MYNDDLLLNSHCNFLKSVFCTPGEVRRPPLPDLKIEKKFELMKYYGIVFPNKT